MHLSKTLLMAKSVVERIREITLRGSVARHRCKNSLLDEKEADYYEKLFSFFDKSGDNHLNRQEYLKLVRYQCNEELSSNFDLNKPFKKMDLNGDNKISMQEYLDHVANSKKRLPRNAELQEIFNMYDMNSDAHINLDELRQILLYMGEDFARPDLRDLFVSVDSDKDGLIDMFQFLSLINKKLRNE